MTRTTICVARRVVVIVFCVLLSQSFNYGQTINSETAPAVVKFRMSIDGKKTRRIWFNRVSKLLAVQREDGSVQIIDATDGHEQTVLPLSDKNLYGMYWTSDGLRLLVAGTTSAALWDARTGERLSTPIEMKKRGKYSFLFANVILSPDEKLLMSVRRDDSFKANFFDWSNTRVQVWNLETGQFKFELKIMGLSCRVTFNPNSKQILTTSDKEDARLWDVQTGRLFTKLLPPYPAMFREGSYAEFSPDGRFVVQGHESGIYIWHSSSGALQTSISFRNNSSDYSLSGSTPDGKMFVTVQQTIGWHGYTSIELHDYETGEVKTTLTAQKWEDLPSQTVWSDDGRTLVIASGNKYKARVWDVAQARMKATFPMLLTYSRIPFDFGYKDRDNLKIHPTLPVISAANDKFIRLWNADTGELLQTLESGGFTEWSADGKLFLTWDKDLTSARVWDVVGPAA